MAQIPDIRPDVNKEPERDKKGAGFFARLFGAGAGTGTVGAGAGGGVLATKAGLLALILVGSTVAGGIGLVGYKVFGPGSDANADKNFTLFAARPKENASADASNAAPKDANSQSLTMFNKANTAANQADANATPNAADDAKAAADAASNASAASAASGNTTSDHAAGAGSTGNGVNKNLLKTGAKFGEMSKNFGGGSGAPVVTNANAGTNTGVAAASRNGASGAMKRGAAVPGGSSRSVASRRGAQSGVRQAMGALADNKGAKTSYGAGRTYDGSAATTGGNPGAMNDIGMAPAASPATSAKSMPNATPTNPNQVPPTPTATMAAPWQTAINTAQMLMGLAALIMMIAFAMKGNPYFKAIKAYLAGIVCLLGVAVIALGAQIGGGQYAQKSQGMVLAAAGLGLTVMGAAMLLDGDKATFKGENTAGEAIAYPDGEVRSVTQGQVDATNVGAKTGDSVGGNAGLWGMNPMVALGGGIAVMGLIGSMMMPLQKYPSSDFANGNPPDARFF